MSDAQLLFWSAIIAAILAYLSNRKLAEANTTSATSSVTKTAFDGLTQTIKTLREELDAERITREEENKKHDAALKEEKELRNKALETYTYSLAELEKRFTQKLEQEREKYQLYIKILHEQLRKADIIPAEWNDAD